MFAREFQQTVGDLGREARSSGVLIQAVDEQATRSVLHQQALQGRQIGTVQGPRHGQHAHLMLAQQVVEVVVTGVLDHHAIPRTQQGTHQQIEGVARALGGEDPLRACADIQPRQALVQLLAQAGKAQGRTIVEQILRIATADLAHRLGQLGARPPRAGQPAAPELEQLVMTLAKLPPAAVAGLAPGQAIVQVQARLALGDKKTGAVARLQPTTGDQAIIGFDHAGRADRLGPRQGADRRQASAGAQALLLNPGLQLVGELLHQRDDAGAVEE
ncbi:hypothetical protein D3C76_520660 [compost metagenome]